MSTSDSPSSIPDDPTPREGDELLQRLSALQAEADAVEAEIGEAQGRIDEILRGGASTGDES